MAFLQPLVSVIMPLYNSEQYVEDAVNSILYQQYRNFELIIVNDGSTDASAFVARSIRDTRILVVDNHCNKGLIYSLNKGIDLAHGQLVARMDSDDLAMPDRLEKQVRFLQDHPGHVMCGSYYYVVDSSGKSKYRVSLPSDSRDIKTYLLLGNCICHSSVMMRAEVLKANRYRPGYAVCEDYDLWVQLAKEGELANIPVYAIAYRVHGNNVSLEKRDHMQHCVRLIQGRALEQVGISFNEEELDIHHALLSFDVDACTRIGLDKVESWALYLLNRLSADPELNQALLEKVIFRRWITICYKSGQLEKLINNRLFRRHGIFYLDAFAGKIRDKIMNRNNGLDM